MYAYAYARAYGRSLDYQRHSSSHDSTLPLQKNNLIDTQLPFNPLYDPLVRKNIILINWAENGFNDVQS